MTQQTEINPETIAALLDVSADYIEEQAAKIERLRGTLLWIRGICAEELELEYNDAMRRAFQRNVRDAAIKALTDPEARGLEIKEKEQ
jgi:hypothetical protein